MKRPDASVRAIGNPRVAPALFLSCVALCTGVYEGMLPIWAAFLAVIMARITFNCLQTMRGYKVWAAEWDAMAGKPAAAPSPSRKKKRSNPLRGFLVGVIAVVMLPWVAAQFQNPRDRLIIGFIWLVMCVAVRWSRFAISCAGDARARPVTGKRR